ncbi:hypothetical protein ACQ4WX_49125 [Streptomyces lasalocidi]
MTSRRAERPEQVRRGPAGRRCGLQEKLEAARAYYEEDWPLCAPRAATALPRRRPPSCHGRCLPGSVPSVLLDLG